MTPAEMRRLQRAGRSLAHAQRLEHVTASAEAVLSAALGDADRASVPGYTVTRTDGALRVSPNARVNADQLDLGLESAA